MNGIHSRDSVTQSLIREGKSDYERWSNAASLMPAWNMRSELIAKLVPENSTVFEFGAGVGALQQHLSSSCTYQKSDLVDRDGETEIFDLNAENLLPIVGFDTAVLSGVLEYIHDVPRTINFLAANFKRVLLSYACLDKNSTDRRSHGWVNDYKISELVSYFKESGFVVYNYIKWKTQTILCLVKLDGNSNPSLSHIEYTFSVSLDESTERQQHTVAEMCALGLNDFSFFSAINYDDNRVKQILASGLVKTPDLCFSCDNNVLIPKQIGNWLSFLSVLSVISIGRYSVAMICEDDVRFMHYASDGLQKISDDAEIMQSLHSAKPTLIRLGYPGFDEKVHSYKTQFEFSEAKTMSNSCFICNAAYAQHVIDSLESARKIEHTSDVYFHNLCLTDEVKAYTVNPPLAFDLSQSKLVPSAIHPKMIDKADKNRARNHVKKIFNTVGIANVFGGNFGDVLGAFIYKQLVGFHPKELYINDLEVKQHNQAEHYLIVGSILKHTTENAWLWGIGIMHNGDELKIKNSIDPAKVYAIRGNKTKNSLESAGIKLPSDVALGDPALLLPLLLKRAEIKKYLFGIIPHFTEYQVVAERYEGHPGVIVINLGDHSDQQCIEETINKITQCEKILSSSLHGIIVGHAYDIPSAWCNFSPITQNQESGTTYLKFHDYFETVNLFDMKPVQCLGDNVEFPRDSSYTLANNESLVSIQADLLAKCPFNLYRYTREILLERMNEAQNFDGALSFTEILGM